MNIETTALSFTDFGVLTILSRVEVAIVKSVNRKI
jgi:hypothetical protein